jgi:hypothetical protein
MISPTMDPRVVRSVLRRIARRAAVVVSLIVLGAGVAMAGSLLPWAVGQLAPAPAWFTALERTTVGSALAGPDLPAADLISPGTVGSWAAPTVPDKAMADVVPPAPRP